MLDKSAPPLSPHSLRSGQALSAAKGLAPRTERSFAAAQDDSQDTTQVRSREDFSPNVCWNLPSSHVTI